MGQLRLIPDQSVARNLAKFLKAVYCQFEAWERYKIADDILEACFRATRNNKLEVVYQKAALLDRLYGTNVFDVFRISEHIVNCKIDLLLKSGDSAVVGRIRANHKIRAKKNGKPKDLYSFATKYASWHRPDVYPIYDGLIGRLLPKLNKKFEFHVQQIPQKSLRDYSKLVAVIDSLTKALRMEHFRYKKIDKALWLWAKYEFRRDQIKNEDVKRGIANAKKSLKIRL